jgi:hypothetical protein
MRRLQKETGDSIMANSITDTVKDAGRSFVDAAKSAGHKIAEGAERAAEFVKDETGMGAEGIDRGVGAITEHMKVIASCGKTVGKVDAVDGNSIKLTRKDSPDDRHHFIPLAWVDHVDSHVHLNRNSQETEQGWSSDAAGCGCG